MDIGLRVKQVREHFALSQRELAKRAGMANATISLIEQNRVSPSISSLLKLIQGFPMTLTEFLTFGEPPPSDPYTFRRDQQPDLGRDGLKLLIIGASNPNRQMRMLRELYSPGADTGKEMITHPEGEECGVVVRGTVELTVDGHISILSAGDGYYFPSTLPHKFRNVGPDEAEIISANTPANF
ncbi:MULTISPECIES: cupin domain-containing protein [Chromobacterium]|uniref:XRE family transcriptional regulator n=1 Tax=Chromobacterium haemolyticum TaxID=394935 RepID=A0A1W0D506_9NEIS|nr:MULTISPECIES: cupin domain-containing protein [Chromobacterium]OQS42066.1 XRE family transcriptional regulator [Chromobacterium haemolyticum]QOZ81646.1 cupin domain-containing protein [Chromobacterium sp. Rain0013]WON85900.1 cupin domain-containing protein [Chromobacterium haemolyticum]